MKTFLVLPMNILVQEVERRTYLLHISLRMNLQKTFVLTQFLKVNSFWFLPPCLILSLVSKPRNRKPSQQTPCVKSASFQKQC